MKLNKTDEKVLKYFIDAKGSNGYVDHEKLKIPKSITDEEIEESVSVLENEGLIKSFSKGYMYQMEPEGFRYFDEKKSNRNSIFFWKFVYTPLAFILGILVTLFVNHLLPH